MPLAFLMAAKVTVIILVLAVLQLTLSEQSDEKILGAALNDDHPVESDWQGGDLHDNQLSVAEEESSSAKDKDHVTERHHGNDDERTDDELPGGTDVSDNERISRPASGQEVTFQWAVKRRMGAALNVRYGTSRTSQPHSALPEAKSDPGGYDASESGSTGISGNDVTSWKRKRGRDGADNGGANEQNVLKDKRRIGSALNVKYRTWKFNNVKTDNSVDENGEDLFEEDKRNLGPALNVRYGKWKPTSDNAFADKEAGVHGKDKRRLGSALNVKYGTWKSNNVKSHNAPSETGAETYGKDKRRLGSALNVKYGTWKLNNVKSDNSLGDTSEELYEKKKRRLGSALNVKYGTWKSNELKSGNSPYEKEEDFFEKDKRRLGSALNAKYGTWKLNRVKSDNVLDGTNEEFYEKDKRRLGSALNVRYASRQQMYKTHGRGNPLGDVTDRGRRRLGSALNVKYATLREKPVNKAEVYGSKFESEKTWPARSLRSDAERDSGISLDLADTAAADKRRLGAALNVNYGHRGELEGEHGGRAERSAGARPFVSWNSGEGEGWPGWGNGESQWSAAEPVKRRLGSALNARFGTWRYAHNPVTTKKPWYVDYNRAKWTQVDAPWIERRTLPYGERAKRSVGTHGNVPEVGKRFMGAALNVRYQNRPVHYYYRVPPLPWVRRSFFLAKSPDGRVRRDLEDPAILYGDRVNDINDGGSNDLDSAIEGHERVPSGDNTLWKRHMGAVANIGPPFPLTRYSPSRYLKPISLLEMDKQLRTNHNKSLGFPTSQDDADWKANLFRFYA